jgi:hypothetical protein
MRRVLRYTWLAVVAALVYAIWILTSRQIETRRLAREAEEREAQRARAISDMYGGGRLKVLSFYASPQVIPKGDKGLICYGVANAKSVKIEPGVEAITPSLSRCLDIKPAADTEFVLTAVAADGHVERRKITVRVE